ncbi:MAG: hypothetical protein FJ395_19955 [Verrucomicrobia bacterium]|nr:hypothetical protein [Verrucomicrobiota bacterium]
MELVTASSTFWFYRPLESRIRKIVTPVCDWLVQCPAAALENDFLKPPAQLGDDLRVLFENVGSLVEIALQIVELTDLDPSSVMPPVFGLLLPSNTLPCTSTRLAARSAITPWQILDWLSCMTDASNTATKAIVFIVSSR